MSGAASAHQVTARSRPGHGAVSSNASAPGQGMSPINIAASGADAGSLGAEEKLGIVSAK
jgi:hypothetical protein